MIYLSGAIRSDLPAMVTPRMRQLPEPGQLWAADNGRYSAPANYSDAGYLAWLERLEPYRDRCLFATAPDVWSDWPATLELSRPMLRPIRELGYRVAIVAQDGATVDTVPWPEVDALFVGGTDPWRHSDALRELVAEARRRELWVHLGRVNSLRRLRFAEALGCDSADGTVLKHDPSRPVADWGPTVRREPSLWSPGRVPA